MNSDNSDNCPKDLNDRKVKTPEKKRRPRSLADALRDKLNPDELAMVPRSFDIIGDIAILEIPWELKYKQELIGNVLISTFKNIRVVASKTSEVKTEYRVRGIEVISGENRTETIHKEYGCRYLLDIKSSYFSPRLGTERMRVAGQVKSGERVLVMFSGIGVYPILIAKTAKPGDGKIHAIELNPDAFRYMEKNILLNKVNSDVIPVKGDVRDKTKSLGKFDRIVMPLPKDAGSFLDIALPALQKKGIIHFYDFSGNPGESIERVKGACSELGVGVEILDAVLCGSYSPGLSRICVDFRVIP